MQRIKQRTAAGLLLLWVMIVWILAACAVSVDESKQAEATVVEVLDGDTFKARVGGRTETIRLLFIDTPETNHPERGEQPFGREAKRFMKELLPPGTKVTLEIGTEERDKYGRLLAHVQVGNRSVQEMLLERGLARVAYVFEANVEREDRYRKAEERARQKRLRIWSVDGYVGNDGYHPEVIAREARFVASRYSEVYHPAECEDAERIKERNRVWFRTEEEAKASGRQRSHSPCWSGGFSAEEPSGKGKPHHKGDDHAKPKKQTLLLLRSLVQEKCSFHEMGSVLPHDRERTKAS
jgi:micrococcal nuclease